jgi:hypothetical protein
MSRRIITSNTPKVKLFGTVVQWFDGTIEGNLLKDKSGNGYDANIINNDITGTTTVSNLVTDSNGVSSFTTGTT